MSKAYPDASEGDHVEQGCSELFVTGGDAPEVFELIEEPLDEIALFLGRVDKVPDPKPCGDDENEADVAFRGFVLVGRKALAVLEL